MTAVVGTRLVRAIACGDKHIDNMAISPDGNILITTTHSNVKKYDLKRGVCLGLFGWADGSFIHSVAISPDGKHFAIGEDNGRVSVYNLMKKEEVAYYQYNQPVYTVLFVDDIHILVNEGGLNIHCMDISSVKPNAVNICAVSAGVTAADESEISCICRDGQFIYIGYENGQIDKYSYSNDFTLIGRHFHDKTRVNAIHIHENKLIAGHESGAIIIFDKNENVVLKEIYTLIPILYVFTFDEDHIIVKNGGNAIYFININFDAPASPVGDGSSVCIWNEKIVLFNSAGNIEVCEKYNIPVEVFAPKDLPAEQTQTLVIGGSKITITGQFTVKVEENS